MIPMGMEKFGEYLILKPNLQDGLFGPILFLRDGWKELLETYLNIICRL
jgi:hypothetical protein